MRHCILLLLVLPLLSSCSGTGINLFGKNVEIVNNRNPDGTFKAVGEIRNSAGESPDSYATVYHFPSGDLGVSVWASGPMQGMKPQLKR